MPRTVFAALGTAVPERVVTNDELARLMDTSDEWITQRTGIKERHWVLPGEGQADLAEKAARAALAKAGWQPGEVEAIVFASLQGELLWLSPGRADAGHHVLRIVATAGSQRAEATLAVDVTRDNTGPTWCAAPSYWMADDAGEYTPMVGWGTQLCPGETCVLGSGPRLIVFPRDAEEDEIAVDAEIVPFGQPFTGTPTLSARQRPGDLLHTNSPECAYFDLPLPGLTPGTDYAFRLRIADEWGASAFDGPASRWLGSESRFRFEPAAP